MSSDNAIKAYNLACSQASKIVSDCKVYFSIHAIASVFGCTPRTINKRIQNEDWQKSDFERVKTLEKLVENLKANFIK